MSDDPPGRLLRSALGFLALEPRAPELQLLHRCFDSLARLGGPGRPAGAISSRSVRFTR